VVARSRANDDDPEQPVMPLPADADPEKAVDRHDRCARPEVDQRADEAEHRQPPWDRRPIAVTVASTTAAPSRPVATAADCVVTVHDVAAYRSSLAGTGGPPGKPELALCGEERLARGVAKECDRRRVGGPSCSASGAHHHSNVVMFRRAQTLWSW
jgi:hypothetical protein